MTSPLIKKTAEYVRKKLEAEPTGHDWYHVERVWRVAKQLQEIEGGDAELVELSALLHDLGDYKHYEFDENKGMLVLRGMMDVLEIEEDRQNQILKTVDEAQYKSEDTKEPSTIEAKLLRDATWLDSLGAIGIARTFATGGRIKRLIYDPKKKPRKKMSKEEYQRKKIEGTSVNFFYEKAFKLPEMMHTKTAKNMAAERIKFIEKYLEEFFAECEGKR